MKVRNKVTGEIVEIPDAPGARPIGPSDPKVPLQVQGAQLGNQRTQQQIDQDAALLPYRKRVMSAQAQKAEREAARAAKGPPPTAGEITRRNELRDKLAAMKNLETNLNDMEAQYQQNLAGQPMSRGFGLSEFLPDFMSANNQKFNKLAKQTGPYIMSILGMSGKATDAAAEYEKKVMPFIPNASDMDSTNAQTLASLRNMLNAQKASTYKELGVPYRTRQRKPTQKRSSDDGWKIEEVK